MRRKVAFIADSLDNAFRFQQVLAQFDVDVSAGSTIQIENLLDGVTSYDLVVFEARGKAYPLLSSIVAAVEKTESPLLVIVGEEESGLLDLPATISSDFVVNGASEAECAARVARLLKGAHGGSLQNVIKVGAMTLNLSTYQVQVAGEPVDFTYLEYALLAFLLQHSGRTFSRSELLSHVWGFDYYGGSRTVDVHIRRIRSKLGPDLAQHLKTIRGVGYLWE